MTRPRNRYDVTITVDERRGHHPNPAEFTVVAEQVASARHGSIMSAHTVGQIIGVVTAKPPTVHSRGRRPCTWCPRR